MAYILHSLKFKDTCERESFKVLGSICGENVFTMRACLCALMSGLFGAGGAVYTVGAAWIMLGVTLSGACVTGRGGAVTTCVIVSTCYREKKKRKRKNFNLTFISAATSKTTFVEWI